MTTSEPEVRETIIRGIVVGAFVSYGMQRGIVDVLNRKGIDDHLVPAVATIGVS